MTTWTWRFEGADGGAPPAADLPRFGFPSQADAESWVGETWKELVDLGIEAVTLLRDGEAVYGPMSLRPAE
jgi:hypothetical protein